MKDSEQQGRSAHGTEAQAALGAPSRAGPTVPPGARAVTFFNRWLFLGSLAWCVVFAFAFPHPRELLADRWPLIAAGVVGATIGNLSAIGGGLVFIPLMMFVYHLDPVAALKLTFVTQAIGMTSGAVGWIQRRAVAFEVLPWALPGLLLGTAVSAFLVAPSPMLVKGLFGPICVVIGALTLATLNRQGHLQRVAGGGGFAVTLVALLGGMVTGWVAIGEGELVAAFLMTRHGLHAPKAVGLGVVLLSLNSILLALLHGLVFGGVPWDYAIFTMLGVLWGGRLGPVVAQRFASRSLKRMFGWIALLDGLLVVAQASGLLTRH